MMLTMTLTLLLLGAATSIGVPFMHPSHAHGVDGRSFNPYPMTGFREMPHAFGGSSALSRATTPVPPGWSVLVHNSYPTTYKDWSYKGSEPTSGITWGLQCKGPACETKTPFMMTPYECLPPLTLSESYTTIWTDSTPIGGVACKPGTFVSNIICKDAACTAVKLECAPLGGLYRVIPASRAMGFWGKHIDYPRVYCNGGAFMDGIMCGEVCNLDFNIFCSSVIKFDV